jgi:hypothetical protein
MRSLHLAALLLICAAAARATDINVRMVFDAYEPGPSMVMHHDTCGIMTGATDSLDEGLEADWPPYGPNQSDARWIVGNAMTRLDLRSIPEGPAGNCTTSHLLNYQLSDARDTFRIRWSAMPAEVDSLWIDNAGANFGDMVHHVGVRSSMPDSVSWVNPAPPGAQVSDFRITLFYRKSLLSVFVGPVRSMEPLLWPMPVRETFYTAQGGARMRLVDAAGRIVREWASVAPHEQLTAAGLRDGVYSVTMFNGGRALHSLMIVLR